MANRREDEKNERIIRNLLKLADNRRCINCNSLGPQYVCTNFWTFVCTACSGIHREFTHRVKSVSMAKFTPQEVSALQGGGNARAKAVYFKEWDPQRHSLPDSSNVERLRDFIKHVYVDRRFTGEKSFDKPPRANMGEADGSLENRSGSRSPAYENSSRYSDRPSPGGRSDDKDLRNNYDERRSPGFDRKSPAGTEIVNDWRREDRFGNGRKSDDARVSDGITKLEVKSPGRQWDSDVPSPPVVRPVREILGDNVSPLRIIEPPKANGGRGTDGSLQPQRTTSSSSLASSNGNPTEIKSNTLASLIDFDATPDPPTNAPVPQPQPTGSNQSVLQSTVSSSSDNNWACFDSPAEKKVTEAPTLNTLDSLLSGLSVPTPVSNVSMFPAASAPVESAFGVDALGVVQTNNSVFPAANAPPPAHFVAQLPPNVSMFPAASAPVESAFGVDALGVVQKNNSVFPTANAPPPAHFVAPLPPNGMNLPAVVSSGGQRPTMPLQPYSGFPASGIQSTSQPFVPQIGGPSSYQPWSSSIAPVGQGALNMPAGQSLQAVARPGVEVAPGGVKQSSSPEVKPTGRQALPEDLFAPTYPYPVRVPAWQAGPPHGFTYAMPYNSAMPMQSFPQPSKSINPFDFSNDLPPVQAPTFPSMGSLHGALPNVAARTNVSHTSQPWMPSQSSYPSSMPPPAQSFASPMPPSAYMGQQRPNNFFPGQGLGGEGAALGSLNPNQQLGGLFFPPASQNTFSAVGGNPFG